MNRPRVLKNRAFEAAMLFAMLVAFGTLAVLLVDTLITGWPQLDAQLFSDPPSTQPDEARGPRSSRRSTSGSSSSPCRCRSAS